MKDNEITSIGFTLTFTSDVQPNEYVHILRMLSRYAVAFRKDGQHLTEGVVRMVDKESQTAFIQGWSDDDEQWTGDLIAVPLSVFDEVVYL